MDRACIKPCFLIMALPAVFIFTEVHAGVGSDTVWQMRYYYNRTLEDCGAGRPLDQCSGLRMRGTDSMKSFEPWDPSPASVNSKGVSMSFTRQDIKYQDLGLRKNNGFVLKPNDFISDSERKIDTLCFFPIDAWTDDRNDAGCSDNRTTVEVEKSCQSMGVDSAAQWVENYKKVGFNHQKQCGFEIKGREDDAQAYWQGVRARQGIKDRYDTIQTQTEIRVPTWKDDEDAQLPILAFIYTPTDRVRDIKGLREAKDDQLRYYNKTSKWVPVVRVDLPRNNNQEAVFTYYDADQAAPIPTVENNCKSYIENATWERREDPYLKGNPWSLMIKPTECGKKMNKAQQHAAYAELFSKYASDPRWQPDNGSMERQFVCHLEWSGDDRGKKIFARDKPTWNLEPSRPVASWDELFKQGCNPF